MGRSHSRVWAWGCWKQATHEGIARHKKAGLCDRHPQEQLRVPAMCQVLCFCQKSYCTRDESLLARGKKIPRNSMRRFLKGDCSSVLAKQLSLTCLQLWISCAETHFTCEHTSLSDCGCQEMHALTFLFWRSEQGCQLPVLTNSLDTSGFWWCHSS